MYHYNLPIVPGLEPTVMCHATLLAMSALSGYLVTNRLIPVVSNYFLTKTTLHGKDLGRKEEVILPESLGIVAGSVYLASYLIFLVITPLMLFSLNITTNSNLVEGVCTTLTSSDSHHYSNNLGNLAAITSIFAMLILGFIDDCYDLRWRYKLIFPTAASIPLLIVYYHSYGDRTTIILPGVLSRYLNVSSQLNLGIFYYIFMIMFVIFCTNAINIYSGINGLEVGQTIVWTVSILLYNVVEITTQSDCDDVHALSLQLLLPFLLCISALYKFNRYPARVFVGDSYCYFAGITIGVVGVLGHFSEESLTFALPQVFNFILSVPQLFKIVPCPRHRLPRLNQLTGLREPSTFEFQYNKLNVLGRLIMKLYSSLGFANMKIVETSGDRPIDQKDSEITYSCNNFTLINLWLSWFGPKSERSLCIELLRLQSGLSFLAVAALTYVKMEHD